MYSSDGLVICVVEIPKGSRNKYEFDPQLGRFKLDRLLFSSVVYPTDYGYVADTLAEDGDPFDALVCVGEPTFPGCRIEARIVGLLEMTDDAGPDSKLLCVPLRDPAWDHVHDLDDLPAQLLAEIAHFFSIYKQPEGKHVDVAGWASPAEGRARLADSQARFRAGQQAEAGT
jgi:inorganic pyrophosphatase